MAAAFVVLALQPLYLLLLDCLPAIAPAKRIAVHVKAAFEVGVLSPDGSPKSRLWRDGEQRTECISLGTGLNQVETPWRQAIAQAIPCSATDMPAKDCNAPSLALRFCVFNSGH